MIKKTIALEGIEILAPIGFYKKERKNKNTFIIDVSVQLNASKSHATDEIQNTFNYETLLAIVTKEMRLECKLIEDVSHRIYSKLHRFDDHFIAINVCIRKKNPPLKGKVKYAKVELQWEK